MSFDCAAGCPTITRPNILRGSSCGRRQAEERNYEEARGAESRADFIHKVGVANKEVREALYWLRLAQDAALVVDGDLDALIREANELVAILTASIKTARQREVTSCGEARSWRRQDEGEPGSLYLCVPNE